MKNILLGPTLTISYSVGLDEAQDFVFFTSSHVMFIVLVQEQHFENPAPRKDFKTTTFMFLPLQPRANGKSDVNSLNSKEAFCLELKTNKQKISFIWKKTHPKAICFDYIH